MEKLVLYLRAVSQVDDAAPRGPLAVTAPSVNEHPITPCMGCALVIASCVARSCQSTFATREAKRMCRTTHENAHMSEDLVQQPWAAASLVRSPYAMHQFANREPYQVLCELRMLGDH